ncbi:MAG: hypothetical protein J5I98_28125 [Phaeodactylibacter sp.]|nr:hypothetical protein [Phaeodactylibacter sp.]
MERAVNSDTATEIIKEQLAIAYLDRCLSGWANHPENKDEKLATEKRHLDHARSQIERAKNLAGGSNTAINNRISEMYVENNDRAPFIIRRIEAVANEINSFSIFGSFMDVILFKLISRVVFSAISYAMVVVMLPYEIAKGFWVNYGLQNQIAAKGGSLWR